MIATPELPSPSEWGESGMIMTAGKYADIVNYCAVAAIKVA